MHVVTFLDQELIPYFYSSSTSSSWGDPLFKSLRLQHFKLDRDEIWPVIQGTVVDGWPVDHGS